MTSLGPRQRRILYYSLGPHHVIEWILLPLKLFTVVILLFYLVVCIVFILVMCTRRGKVRSHFAVARFVRGYYQPCFSASSVIEIVIITVVSSVRPRVNDCLRL